VSKFISQLQEFLKDIKFSHSIFAFPFAISAFFIEIMPMPNFLQISLLVVCMISARSFAMGINRLFDHKLDAENDRTKNRSIPAGRLKVGYGVLFCLIFASIFIYSTYYLSPLAFRASAPVLIFLGGYSLMKRLHFITHLYLGICLGLAPNAVYAALTNEFSLSLCFLGLAIAVWTAGFDILYSLQDMHHDKKAGLKSVPSFFGAKKSIYISRILFSAMIALLVYVGDMSQLGLVYYLGVAFVGAVLVYEHFLINGMLKKDRKKSDEVPNIGKVFFDLNAWVSVGFMCFVILDKLY
jgi:4-hydroxybenzoate polyprenyltransferase